MAEKQKCACGCGRIVKRTKRGRQALFASNACRQRSYRRKVKQLMEQCKSQMDARFVVNEAAINAHEMWGQQ